MASHVMTGQPWPDGTVVSVYLGSAWPDPTQPPGGTAVTSATVAAGAITFSGLSTQVQYVAYAAGLGKRFLVPNRTPTDSDRARLDTLEAFAAGSSSTLTDLTPYARKPGGTSGIMFVDSGGSDANDGRSWGAPKATLAAALAQLPTGGRLYVAPGSDFSPVTTLTLNGHVVICDETAQAGLAQAQAVIRHKFNGDLFRFADGGKGGGLRGFLLNSQQVAGVDQTGAALAGASTAGSILGYIFCERLIITGTGWERVLNFDGTAHASGFRSAFFREIECFGAYTAGETIRLARPIHVKFQGVSISQAPLAIQQGVKILDPISEDVYWNDGEVLGDWSTEAAGHGIVFQGRISGTITCQAGSANNKFFGVFDSATWNNLGGSGNERSGLAAAARAKKTASQSLASATATAITLDAEDFDTEALHDTVTNNSRLTIRTAGKYLITGAVVFAASVTGERAIMFRRNGITWLGGDQRGANPTAADQTVVSASTVYDLAAGDYVELWAQQVSGGALNVDPSSTSLGIPTHLAVERLG